MVDECIFRPSMRISFIPILVLLLLNGCTSSGRGDDKSSLAVDINNRKQQAHALMAEGQYQAAVDVLKPLATTGAKDSQLYFMLGNAYWKTGDYNAAVSSFETGFRLHYGDAMAHRDFGEMLMEMGKVGRALTEFELAIQFGAQDALSRYNYGLALYEFGRKDAALAQWELAYALDPQNAKYSEAVGIGLTGKDDLKALDYFQSATDLGADEPAFHNNYGLLLMRLDRLVEAARHFRIATEGDASNNTYRLNLAIAYLRSKNFGLAIPVLESLTSESPDDETVRVYLGRAYYEQGRHQDVVDLFEAWLESGSVPDSDGSPSGAARPGLADACDALAMSFRGTGDLEKAALYSAKSVELQPDNPAYLNNYGVILAESGRIEEAKAQWRKVLSLEPDNAVAKQNLSAVDQ